MRNFPCGEDLNFRNLDCFLQNFPQVQLSGLSDRS